jgi:hypothetical protein
MDPGGGVGHPASGIDALAVGLSTVRPGTSGQDPADLAESDFGGRNPSLAADNIGGTCRMQNRSLRATALSLASISVAVYGLVAGIALFMVGTIATFGGSDRGVAMLVLGAIMFATGMTALFVGYGFWSKKDWSWAGGIVIFSVMMVAIVAMGVIGANVQNLLLPFSLGVIAILYLLRPGTRVTFLGTPALGEDQGGLTQRHTADVKVSAEATG